MMQQMADTMADMRA
jgi:hypothetical protein